MGDLTECAAQVLHEVYDVLPGEARRRYRETSGLPFAKQLEVMFPDDPRNEDAAKLFESRKRHSYFDKSFYRDAVETIDYLKNKGLKVVISSGNKQEILLEFLAKKKMDVDLVLGYRPNFLKGPHHFAHISQQLKIGSTAMIFVGDSLHDAKSAYGSDIDFIGKEGLFSDDDFKQAHPGSQSIKNLSELKNIL